MRKGLLILAALAMALAPMSASAAVVRVYGGWYGPYWGPYWGPAYMGPYYAYPNSGQVKLDTKVKDALVYIDGSYAGTTHENKTMRLRPGSYTIEIREAGQTPFTEKVFVIAGRTVHLHPEL
jgi:opacity protein-like surface antigen